MVYVAQSQTWCRKLITFDFFFHVREEESSFAITKCASVHNFVYFFLVFLLLAIMVCQLHQSFTVLLPHFASVQFHFIFKAFHLCVQIHQSHCSVPSWGCILSSYICTVMFEFPCLLRLYLKKADGCLLYFS